MIKPINMKLAGLVAGMGAKKNVCGVLAGKLQERSPLGRPRRRWEDTIKMDPRELEWGYALDSTGSG
jgi:hypothetical protein